MINQEVYNLTNKTIKLIDEQLRIIGNTIQVRYLHENNRENQPMSIDEFIINHPIRLELNNFNLSNESDSLESYNNRIGDIVKHVSESKYIENLPTILNNYVDKLKELTQ